MVYKRKQDFDYSEGDDYVDNEDNVSDIDEGCLHCHRKVKSMPRIRVIDDDDEDDDNDSNDGGYCGDSNIQVRCDDCRGYICNGCHWCHEFQANHEIRVCDRCDAFYCRDCDEMDQCDDCGEVVCGSCSTLLSCKFCGGGLCEECATACGRCGIVLCSRDAKFAVDCDTCRLSYCLVCLASGSKDPCVRCGHRPSKRMEQLVHLRLKSIYKAFKSSTSNNNIGGPTGSGGGGNHGNNSTAICSHGRSRENSNDLQCNNNKKDGDALRSRRNKPTTLQDMVGDQDDEDGDPTMSMMMGAAAGVLPEKFCQDLKQNYLAEQKKADAAAEALLAELEEEETAMAQKKSKKKKKKERKNANKQSQLATKGNIGGDEGEKNSGGDAEEKNKVPQNDISLLDNKDDEMNTDPLSETDSTDQNTKVDDEVGNKLRKAQETKMDPIEKELVECVNSSNLDGIENILYRLKGVPGRSSLRKNAKKALKRLKLELNPPPPVPPEPRVVATTKIERKSTAAANRSSSTMSKTPPVALDSRTSSKKTTNKSISSNDKSSHISPKPSHPKSSTRKKDGTNRCEATVEIVSRLVGWMIGKNGQRIRDLMEESGAKIWIDQEKFKGQETRNVYISGDRKSVDQAVLLVNDVIINAPPPQGTTSNIGVATTSMANMTISQKPHGNSGKTAGLISPSKTHSVQSALPGTAEVKSAWAKASGNNLLADEMQGTIPKPPTLISSSTAGTTAKFKERPSLVQDPGVQNIEIMKNECAPDLLTSAPKTSVDMAAPAVDTSIASNIRQKSDEAITEIVTCDSRFVPLLIGKRGWTIKNIQDDSGARVDIDQTVTPRQVRISGSKANVDKAVTMVRDVLSYPHAQLQCSSEGVVNEENGVLPELGTDIQLSGLAISTPTKQKLLAASAILEHDVIKNNITRQGEMSDRIHSPPPVVGDAKTAISASSSLSSTPDPSIASSSKGFIASHIQNGPLLPPPSEQYNMSNSPSHPASRQFLQSEAGLINGVNVRGLWTTSGVGSGSRVPSAPQASFVDSGHIEFPGYRVETLPNGVAQLQQQQQLQMDDPMAHVPRVAQLNQQQQHLQMNDPMAHVQQQHVDRISQFSNQRIGNNEQNHNMDSSLGGAPLYNLYSNEGVPAAKAIATTPLRDLMHHTGVSSGPVVSSTTRGPEFAETGRRLWNSGNPGYPSSGLQPQLSSGFAATSIGYSEGHHQEINKIGISNSINYMNPPSAPSLQVLPTMNPLPMASNTTETFSGTIPSGPTNDDSRMIDSLFGGANNVQSSNGIAANGLLVGFNGLSLPSEGDAVKPSGLWGSPNLTDTWRDGGAEAPNVSSIDNLFSNEHPSLSHEHPQESRFNWDSRTSNQ